MGVYYTPPFYIGFDIHPYLEVMSIFVDEGFDHHSNGFTYVMVYDDFIFVNIKCPKVFGPTTPDDRDVRNTD